MQGLSKHTSQESGNSSRLLIVVDDAYLRTSLRQQFGQFVATQVKDRHIPALLVSHDVTDRQFATGKVLRLDEYLTE